MKGSSWNLDDSHHKNEWMIKLESKQFQLEERMNDQVGNLDNST